MTRSFFLLLFLSISISAQVPMATQIQIVKAEDSRRYDQALEALLAHSNEKVRTRAALAAGRIGDEAALSALTALLEKEQSVDVSAMAAFAIGEIESIKAAEVILRLLGTGSNASVGAPPKLSDSSRVFTRLAGTSSVNEPQVTARLLEAAGKIAAANASDPRSKELGAAVVSALDAELKKGSKPSVDLILSGLTAVLRARPAGAEVVVRQYLAFTDFEVNAVALNTLARLRAKNANRDARDLLETNVDAMVRANAARVLGAADDKEAVDILIKAATTDVDSRVRVSAIRALGAIKVAKSAEPLLVRGEALLEAYKKNLKPNFVPTEQNEFIEVSNAIGQVLAKTGNARAIALFREFAKIDDFRTAEPYVARVKVGAIRPGSGLGDGKPPTTYRQYSTLAQTIGELADYEPESDEGKKIKDEAPGQFLKLLNAFLAADAKIEAMAVMAAPDALQAYARFKTADLGEIARTALQNNDVQTRAAAAGVLADLPASKENVDLLKSAFTKALLMDKRENDAQLAMLDALFKLDKKESVGVFLTALNAQDYLVRKKAFELLADKDLQTSSPGLPSMLANARAKGKDKVLPYSPVFGTKLGQVLNTDVDYRRALSRKNGSVSAVFTTAKGTFTIEFLPEDAPLTVDNFIKLARIGYFNGVEVHRVVPNFVMQDGDPRGDGNGSPGWSIRCEVNMVPYDRGAVGMALSGKDTGGSQWFVTHSPQPHLDGGYTVFGRVNETGMKVVDNIVRGDKIVSVRIIERSLPQKGAKDAKR